jgi:hypothetical protein
VKRVGDDLGQPHEPGLDIPDHEQLHGAEQQPTQADPQPDLTNPLQDAV